jgi:Flp pilus assembly pilin Flp
MKGGGVFSKIRSLNQRAGDDGQTLVEYTLILMLVVLLSVTALQVIGTNITQFISDAAAGVGGA